MRNRGRRVEVDVMGSTITGWMYGEVPTGLYIALDTDAKDIRFIREGLYTRVYYPQGGETARFLTQDPPDLALAVDHLTSQLREPMTAALDRIDYNHVKRLGTAIRDTRAALAMFDSGRMGLISPTEASNGYELMVSARNIFAAVIDELDRSGITQVLREHLEAIRQVVSPSTLPQVDGQVVSWSELQELIQAAQREPLPTITDFGRQFISQPINVINGTVIIWVVIAGAAAPPPEKEEDAQAGFWRIIKGWSKVLLASGLALANVVAGISSGIVTSIATLGLGTVPVVVGVATSSYTGLKGAVDALAEMHGREK